jgi:diguanylate cyclase (GGDEF)-like protein
MRRCVRLALLVLLVLIGDAGSPAAARNVEVARLEGARADASLAAVRDAPESAWVAADAIRRQPQPSWWRLRIAPDGVGARDEPWVIALKETYDAQIELNVPRDYRTQRAGTFDPSWRQVGSRHRLAFTLPADAAGQPVYLRLVVARGQPIRAAAVTLSTYSGIDLARVRFTSMVLSALVLLALVAATYAAALRRWRQLMFALWVVSAAIYVLVMSGEIAAWTDSPAVLRNAMVISGVATNLGMVAVYGFVIGFLDLDAHYPRLARAMRALVTMVALLIAWLIVDPRSALASQLINLVTLGLSIGSLAGAALRALAGSPQGWFFLVGWGSLTVVGSIRAWHFLQFDGTPPWLEVAHPVAYVFGAFVLVLATARAARYAEREMHAARVVARTDPLTRLPNRAQFEQQLERLVAHARDTGQPLSVMFLDLDRFKAINDTHGHAAGDHCLEAVSDVLRRHVRASDVVVRYGGEEFVLALDGAGLERAAEAAELLRAAVEAQGCSIDGRRIALTVSIGVAELHAGEDATTLLSRADAALYLAKQDGRNRVACDRLFNET